MKSPKLITKKKHTDRDWDAVIHLQQLLHRLSIVRNIDMYQRMGFMTATFIHKRRNYYP